MGQRKRKLGGVIEGKNRGSLRGKKKRVRGSIDERGKKPRAPDKKVREKDRSREIVCCTAKVGIKRPPLTAQKGEKCLKRGGNLTGTQNRNPGGGEGKIQHTKKLKKLDFKKRAKKNN